MTKAKVVRKAKLSSSSMVFIAKRRPERLAALQKLPLQVGDLVKYVPVDKCRDDQSKEEEEGYQWKLAYEGKTGKLLCITPDKRCCAAFEDGLTYSLVIEPWDILKVAA